ncbi:MAG TPA: hypothetical protein VGM20_14990 [Gemmatimonadales bacterium]
MRRTIALPECVFEEFDFVHTEWPVIEQAPVRIHHAVVRHGGLEMAGFAAEPKGMSEFVL